MRSFTRCITVLLFCLTLLSLVAVAQTSSTQGAITGSVTDASQAVLPGVKVTLSGAAVMGTPSVTTDGSGMYRFSALAPGDYKLTFEHEGFATQTREGVHISLGFTARVNVEMSVGAISQNVTVTEAGPTIDLQSNQVSTTLSADRLASLPGSRDLWAVVAQAPAVSMSRMDVGGSGALTQQSYTAYGLNKGGANRGEVEGIMVNEGAGGGGSEMYYTDYGAMTEISVNAVGNGAEMPNPGVLSQLIAKTGGNQYHGDVYLDYENDSMEGSNIDTTQAAQLAKTLPKGSPFKPTDLNRLSQFRDFNADLGGYVVKDKLWWYFAYRNTHTAQRYPTLLDDIQNTTAPVYSAKGTYNINQNQKLIGFYQHQDKPQPDYLGSIVISPGGRTSPALQTKATTWSSVYPVYVWKGEYQYVIRPNLLLQVRGGKYYSGWARTGKSPDPRIEDTGSNFVSGGMYATASLRSRPQFSGSLSYTHSGWMGTHNFKFGGEYMRDTLTSPFKGFVNSCNCISIFNNGTPQEVRLYQGSNTALSGDASTGLYVTDAWQVTNRLSLNLGVRFDRQNIFLPAQTGPAGQQFAAVDSAVAWNNFGPRIGFSYDLSGHGTTVLKSSFGQYYIYPAADFGSTFNPNSVGWYTQYKWTDLNANGHWDAGEQFGNPTAAAGGTASAGAAPNLKQTYTLQSTVYVEHQLARNFTVRTGYVWNGMRQVNGSINANRPLSAYNVPVTVVVQGPDGKPAPGSPTITAWTLDAAHAGLPTVNLVSNLPENANYHTWEITANKRQENDRWSLLASFAKTWARESPLGTGSSFTPNALINSSDGVREYNNWQAKVNATVRLPYLVRVTPIVRFQSGTPFGRTYSSRLSYGTATILSEPYNTERTPNIALFDLRTEKQFRVRESVMLTGFFDLYNIMNSNKVQAVSTASGSGFLNPSAITPPRIARLGVKFQF